MLHLIRLKAGDAVGLRCNLLTESVLSITVIRAKVVGKKLMKDGPFGTMRYTVKQMKVSIYTSRLSGLSAKNFRLQ